MSKARIVLPIEGMSCAACATTVQQALGGAAGVTSATVNYASGRGGSSGAAAAPCVVPSRGPLPLGRGPPDAPPRGVALGGRLLMRWARRPQRALPAVSALDPYWIKLALAALTLPVIVWSGRQFYRGAWSGFRHRTADMNTLIGDRKSTRLNSSHLVISYAVFCLKKKK